MFRFQNSGVFMALIVLIVVAASPVAAHEHEIVAGSEIDPERILTSAEFFRYQAEHYADQFGVSVEEAENRLELYPLISALTEYLEDNHRDVYAELRAENGPDFRVVVQVTAGGEGLGRVRKVITTA